MMQVCRVCLVTDGKFFDMRQHYSLHSIYEHIVGTMINDNDGLSYMVCWECAHRLLVSSHLKRKALRSRELMIEILNKKHFISPNKIKSIDRSANNLISSLSCKSFKTNHYDLHVDDTEDIFPDNTDYTDQIENNDDTLQIKDEIDTTVDLDFNADENSDTSSDIILAQEKKRIGKVKKSKTKVDFPKIDRRRKPANEVLDANIFDIITNVSYEEQMSEMRRREGSANYVKSDYKCVQCFKGFLDEEAFRCHLIRHTDESGTHECEICKVRFKNSRALQAHRLSHMQRFTCKRCPYVTARRHAAIMHEKFHKGTRYQCPQCGEDFCKVTTYMSHIRIKHPSDFVCQLCGYSFVSEKGLGLHKKLKHRLDELTVPSEDSPYCQQCDVRFLTTEALDRHRRTSAKHDDVDTKDTSRRRRARRQHGENGREKKINSEKKSCKPADAIPCEQCGIQLPDSVAYYRHFRRAHPDKNRTSYPADKARSMCEVCGKMFQSLALLQDHSSTHTDSKQFKCGQCGKSFQRQYRLIAHRRVHGARAHHACAACGKTFTTASNMQRHMVIHTGLKPFKCEMCGKCFKHASEKRVHITYVHLKKPWPKRSRGKRRPDTRQSQPPLPPPTELDIVQPLWPGCNDPKIADISTDKHVYYNLKI